MTFLLPPPVLLLHHPCGVHPTAGGQHGIGTLHHGLSNRFVSSSRCENFRLQKNSDSRVTDGRCTQDTLSHAFFSMRTVCQVMLSGSHPSLTFHALAWLKMKQCAFSETVHTSRNMTYITPELTSTFSPCTRTPSCPSARPTSSSPIVHSGEINPCHDPQQVSIASTCDSAESIATPHPESDLDDGQIRALLASPLYMQEREASADRSQVYHSVRENLVSSSPQVPKSTGKPVAFKKPFPTEGFSSERQQILGNNEPLYFRFSTPEKSIKSSPGNKKSFMLAEAKYEVRKQECRAEFLDRSVRDLQRQLASNRLEIYCTNQGHEESRKEQARLHEELAQRESVLRETQIRSIHEVGELKKVQEMRIDEFSRNDLTP